ncbi:glycine, alanine and asparagine-rich protein-like [Penaeus monodon]|uniref:glycine, alanine and asparagine-rich protein-like n=1 Tax=Penaeus monodon TaxID=6687 RepID=UPI0018A6EF0D|nr:glycine, alanine and asparagine-rich protein-like [Penaeus monodon]
MGDIDLVLDFAETTNLRRLGSEVSGLPWTINMAPATAGRHSSRDHGRKHAVRGIDIAATSGGGGDDFGFARICQRRRSSRRRRRTGRVRARPGARAAASYAPVHSPRCGGGGGGYGGGGFGGGGFGGGGYGGGGGFGGGGFGGGGYGGGGGGGGGPHILLAKAAAAAAVEAEEEATEVEAAMEVEAAGEEEAKASCSSAGEVATGENNTVLSAQFPKAILTEHFYLTTILNFVYNKHQKKEKNPNLIDLHQTMATSKDSGGSGSISRYIFCVM